MVIFLNYLNFSFVFIGGLILLEGFKKDKIIYINCKNEENLDSGELELLFFGGVEGKVIG